MHVPGPTRITIELHPGADGSSWSARTSVDDGDDRGAPAAEALPTVAMTAEPREDLPLPAAYEPGDCTCLEDGGCDRDHANE